MIKMIYMNMMNTLLKFTLQQDNIKSLSILEN